MRSFAVSAIGRDHPGIVAGVTRVLLDHALNIEDARAGILRGQFSMTLIVSGEDHVTEGELRLSLEGARERLGLEAVVGLQLDGLQAPEEPEPTHAVTVLGLDRPGAIHAVCARLSEIGIGVCELDSHVAAGEGEQAQWAMRLAVIVPGPREAAELEHALGAIGRAAEIEISLSALQPQRG